MDQDFFINRASNKLSVTGCDRILRNSSSFDFHSSLPGYKPTPLLKLSNLGKRLGVANLFVKDETFRFGLNAFKGLGASYAINTILKDKPYIETFCTATDGNHGRAVAWSAKREGKRSIIFVPAGTTQSRVKAIEKEGADVTIIDGTYDETCEHALKISKESGWELVQDTAWDGYEDIPARIMAGYLTLFQELEDSIHILPEPTVDIVFLQAGVGSWAATAIWYYFNRYGEQRPKMVIVEPKESDGILESFKNSYRTKPLGSLETIMAGLNCGIPSKSAWEINASCSMFSV